MGLLTDNNGNRRRVPGLTFYKRKGRREWLMHFDVPFEKGRGYNTFVGVCAAVDTAGDPRKERFHYCSGTSQPVFLDSSWDRGWPSLSVWTTSSWNRLPEGWKDAFREYMVDHGLWPASREKKSA